METKNALTSIEKIFSLINMHCQENLQHQNSCQFLNDKYIELKQAIINNSENLADLIEWNRWFAPRIIYEGIGNKNLLIEIEKLDSILKKLILF